MLILAAADIHARPDNMRHLKNAVVQHDPDVIVIPGDLTRFNPPEPLIQSLSNLNRPVFAITGNTDTCRVRRLLDTTTGFNRLDKGPVTRWGIRFAGVSGALLLPFCSPVSFRERVHLGKLSPSITRDTVLVVHPPPRGILDAVGGRIPSGSFGIRRFILDHEPGLVLCGHIHEAAGTAVLGKSLIVNCAMGTSGRGALIDMSPGVPPNAVML